LGLRLADMVGFLTIEYHLGRLGNSVVISSSNNFAQPSLFFQVFRHFLRVERTKIDSYEDAVI